jgi:hypothetical protein
MSTIAVFLLGAGGATAAGKLIDGKNIRKGSIQATALSKGTKKALTGPAGPAGAAGQPGAKGDKGDKGDPGAAATRLWGVVKGNGILVRNSGIKEVSHGEGAGAQGRYDIIFSQDITGCAIIASIGEAGTSADDAPGGFIGHKRTGDDRIRVEVANTDNVYTDTPFHVAVFC